MPRDGIKAERGFFHSDGPHGIKRMARAIALIRPFKRAPMRDHVAVLIADASRIASFICPRGVTAWLLAGCDLLAFGAPLDAVRANAFSVEARPA